MTDPRKFLELAEIEREQDNRRRVFLDSYQCGSEGWNDISELEVLNHKHGAALNISLADLRDCLDFLEGLGLISITKLAVRWDYKITSYGTQCYEGDAPWPKGVSPK